VGSPISRTHVCHIYRLSPGTQALTSRFPRTLRAPIYTKSVSSWLLSIYTNWAALRLGYVGLFRPFAFNTYVCQVTTPHAKKKKKVDRGCFKFAVVELSRFWRMQLYFNGERLKLRLGQGRSLSDKKYFWLEIVVIEKTENLEGTRRKDLESTVGP